MEYVVRSGDTLGKIAKELLGDSARYMEIARENGMENPNLIRPGQVLKVSGATDARGGGQTSVRAARRLGEGSELSESQLAEICPAADRQRVEMFTPALNNCMARYEINTPLRAAHFIAQIAHESGSFRYVVENLNYSAKALRAVFGKYFPSDDLAEQYARQPEKIANRVYASRMGNGDEASGEGWAYRGRGLIQLTGKDNYQAFGESLGEDLTVSPDSVATDPELAVSAAAWFWDARNLNSYADQDDIRQITRRINGGYHGLEDREQFYQRARKVLGV